MPKPFDRQAFLRAFHASDYDLAREVVALAEKDDVEALLAGARVNSVRASGFDAVAGYAARLASLELPSRLAIERDIALAELALQLHDAPGAHRLLLRTVPKLAGDDPLRMRAYETLLPLAYNAEDTAVTTAIANELAAINAAPGHSMLGWLAVRRGEGLYRQGEHLLRATDPSTQSEAFFRAQSTYTLCVVARELPPPAFHDAARSAYARMQWTSLMCDTHFFSTYNLAWLDALVGDDLSTLRTLKRLPALAYSPVTQITVKAAHAYFLRAFGRPDVALGLAREAYSAAKASIWGDARDESRHTALILLAEVLAAREPGMALQCLARLRTLETKVNVAYERNLTKDRRIQAFMDFPAALAHAHLGNAAEARRLLTRAYDVFEQWGIGYRSALAALALHDLGGDPAWLSIAVQRIEPWPKSWIARDIAARLAGTATTRLITPAASQQYALG
jgi:hypothetical protein